MPLVLPAPDPDAVMHCVHWMYGARCCRCESNDDDPSGECDLAPGEEPYGVCPAEDAKRPYVAP